MVLRSARERAIQTLAYEAGGLVISVPLYLTFTGSDAGQGLLVMVALSGALLLWSPLHNTAFDWVDLRLTGRVASDRPQRIRLIHAGSHEATSVVVTVPVLMWLGGHGMGAAIAADLGLTLIYAAYAYVFHLIFDWLRPVRPFRSTGFSA